MSENRFGSIPLSTVEWLLENYEVSEGTSLPRSTLYSNYVQHCNETNIVPVNAASFGKIIRSVFCGIQTRRLGTRGNSKYHYHGIRMKQESALPATPYNIVSNNFNFEQRTNEKFLEEQEVQNMVFNQSTKSELYEYLGPGTNAIPDLPEILLTTPLPDECTYEDIIIFRSLYREHCISILNAVLNLEFESLELVWKNFWCTCASTSFTKYETENYLSKPKLLEICSLKPVQLYISKVDMQFYRNLIQVLLPDILRPIPYKFKQAINNFAKSLENWLSSSMTGWPQTIITLKFEAVSTFSTNLLRYVSLNDIVQKSRIVLDNNERTTQMLLNLSQLDVHDMKSRMLWVCEFDDEFVLRIVQDFKLQLQHLNSLEEWASRIKYVVQTALKPFEGKTNFLQMARQFLLKWSFFSSMVIRQLSIEFASGFGPFQLIQMVFDEYMFYLVHQEFIQPTITSEIKKEVLYCS